MTASASEEALRAREETGRLDLAHVGVAARELGHIRLRLGDTEGAEQAFRRAHEYGISPEPGMSLVRLVRGAPVGATQGLQTALDGAVAICLSSVRLTPARRVPGASRPGP